LICLNSSSTVAQLCGTIYDDIKENSTDKTRNPSKAETRVLRRAKFSNLIAGKPAM
jgi:hypothetical protein